MIGKRPIHHSWHLFSAHFQTVLLPPQRRPDGSGVSWTWREAVEQEPFSAAELAGIRQKLEVGNRAAAEHLGEVSTQKPPSEGRNASDVNKAIREAVEGMVTKLIKKKDSALAGFVCRTDAGLMLHSWGAPQPGRPYHPDEQACSVSGSVVMGDSESAAGIAIVIESPQGNRLFRTVSDGSGAFRFEKIGAGNYRVRVIERGNFPPQGIAVTVGRDSITGLELHRGAIVEAAGKSSPNSSPIATADLDLPSEASANSDAPPAPVRAVASSRKRGLVAGLVLAVVAVGGGIWWYASETSPAANPALTQPAITKSESAQPNSSRATRNSPDGSGGSGVSKVITSSSQSSSESSSSRGLSGNGGSVAAQGSSAATASNSASELPGSPSAADEISSAIQTDALLDAPPGTAEPTAVADTLGNASNSTDPATVGRAHGDPRVGATGPGADSGPSTRAEPNAAKSTPKAAKIKPKRASTKTANAIGPPADADLSAPEIDSTQASASTDGTPLNPKAPPGPSVKNASSSLALAMAAKAQSAPEAPLANDDSTSSDPSSDPLATVGPTAEKANRSPSKNAPRTKPSKLNGIPAAVGASEIAGSESSPSNEDSTHPAEAPASGSDANAAKASGSSSSEKPAATESKASDDSGTDTSADENSAPTDSFRPAQPTNTSKLTAGAAPAKAAARSAPIARASPPTEASDRPDQSGASPPEVTARRLRKNPQKTPTPPVNPADSPADLATASSELARDQMNSAPGVTSNRPIIPGIGTAVMVHRLEIRASKWQPTLIQDQILPTHPVTASEDDAMEASRERLLKERRERMPQLFRRPVATSGFVLEVSDSTLGPNDSPHWENLSGQGSVETHVNGHRTEVCWAGTTPPANLDLVLRLPDGREIARIGTKLGTGGAGPALQSIEGIHSWYWVGIEPESIAGNLPAVSSPKTKLEWRFLTGESIPASWPREEQWRGGRGNRISIPLIAANAVYGLQSLALIDRSSGWALACEIFTQ